MIRGERLDLALSNDEWWLIFEFAEFYFDELKLPL